MNARAVIIYRQNFENKPFEFWFNCLHGLFDWPQKQSTHLTNLWLQQQYFFSLFLKFVNIKFVHKRSIHKVYLEEVKKLFFYTNDFILHE